MTDRVSVRPARADDRSAGEAMTFPAYRHLLSLERSVRLPRENDQEPVDPVVIVAEAEGELVGLAVADIPVRAVRPPELLSVFVRPSHRRRGISRQLIAAAADAVRDHAGSTLLAVYMTGKPGPEYFERAALSLGWAGPQVRMVSVRFSAESLAPAPWLGKYRVGEGFEIFPWTELTDEDRRYLVESQREENWIAADLQPWDHDRFGFEPRTSLGLRRDGKVVGWIINHEVDGETLRFTCSYIRKPLGRMGKIIPLYSESFQRFIGSGFRYATFTTPLHHKGMAAFAKRWFAPWSTFLGETRSVEKAL